MSDFKPWVEPTPEMNRRKVYDYYINDKPHPVYDIAGTHHSLGSGNGNAFEDTYWIEYGDELCPFSSRFMHRLCWEIRYKQNNYTKYKWNDWDFRKSGKCEMYVNGRLIYAFSSYDMNFALAKAQYLQVKLLEFPGYNFIDPEENKGRKVWYYGLPATIQPKHGMPWEITIHPDLSEMDSKTWWRTYTERSVMRGPLQKVAEDDLDDLQETVETGYINWGDVLACKNIDWFRK